MMFYKLLHIGVFLQLAVSNIAEPCTLVDPATTIEYVHSCPGSSTEWLKAAQRKNCSAYQKTCGDNKPFRYNCVMNAYRNATLEICFAETSIVGYYCPEYNEYGNLIQEHYGTVCKSCPFYYYSTEMYKYPECYQYQNTKEKNATLVTTDNDPTTSFGSTSTQKAFKRTTTSIYRSASTTATITTTKPRTSALQPIVIVLGCVLMTFMMALPLYGHLWRQVKCSCKEKMYKRQMDPSDYQLMSKTNGHNNI